MSTKGDKDESDAVLAIQTLQNTIKALMILYHHQGIQVQLHK